MPKDKPKNDDGQTGYSEQEAQERFEAALRGALKTPHKPLNRKSPKESDEQKSKKH